MRKLKLQVQMTIDGYVGRQNGDMDWMIWDWDDGIKEYVNNLTDSIDTILLGRKMTDGFITHWTNVLKNPADESYDFAKIMVNTPKVVFSKNLQKSNWANTKLANGDLVNEVNILKNQAGKGIIVYGGASFVSSLIKANLIDEYHLFINPAVIGSGLTIFNQIDGKFQFNHIKTIPFKCGIVLMLYQPKM